MAHQPGQSCQVPDEGNPRALKQPPNEWRVSESVRRLNPELFGDPGGEAPSPILEPGPLSPLAHHPPTQGQHPKKRLVRITCFRVRKQDPDNGIYKWHVDAIRKAGLIENDTDDDIELQTAQVKVKTKAEERTEIQITMMQ